MTYTTSLLHNFININYSALCVGAGGLDELIIREYIPVDTSVVPTIYNGLPLRSEFRVFYDFDIHKVLYTVNYWDYDYCREGMYEKSDQIVFEAWKDTLETEFNRNKSNVEQVVAEAMEDVKLDGTWSVDILLDEHNKLWLIDMALAENSTYWDTTKISDKHIL